MATTEQYVELLKACTHILSLEPNKQRYSRRPEWGELSFDGIESHLDMVFLLTKRLKSIPENLIVTIPDGIVTHTISNMATIFRELQEIDDFKISQDNAQSIHTQRTNSLRDIAEKFAERIGPWITLLSNTGEETDSLSGKIRAASDEVVKTLDETRDYAQKKTSEIESVLKVARTQSGEAGAAAFTKQFEVEARAAKRRSAYWLIPTGAFALAALVLSILFMLGLFTGVPTSSDNHTAVSTFQLVYAIGGRIVGISVLFYASIWSGRVALANMHLSSVNKHRAISLETLQAFQNAVDDNAARDAVVLEAARAVYENVPSGYIGRQIGEHGGGGRILELIRSAKPQSDSYTSAGPPQQ